MEKMFKTLEEQIEILKGKGLIVEDNEETKEIPQVWHFMIKNARSSIINTCFFYYFYLASNFV